MTTQQILLFSILGVLILFSIFVNALSKKQSTKMFSLFLLIYALSLLLTIAIIQTLRVNELKKQINNKCPEYEKIENVYKLKTYEK